MTRTDITASSATISTGANAECEQMIAVHLREILEITMRRLLTMAGLQDSLSFLHGEGLIGLDGRDMSFWPLGQTTVSCILLTGIRLTQPKRHRQLTLRQITGPVFTIRNSVCSYSLQASAWPQSRPGSSACRPA